MLSLSLFLSLSLTCLRSIIMIDTLRICYKLKRKNRRDVRFPERKKTDLNCDPAVSIVQLAIPVESETKRP
uniref:Putative secreted protein n=1 Tax=Anopheles triannulatus TaxID=58253 RepID=A0A2M4B1R6_9DIPT